MQHLGVSTIMVLLSKSSMILRLTLFCLIKQCFSAQLTDEKLLCRYQQKAAWEERPKAQHGYLCHWSCIWVQSRCSVLCHSGHHTANEACCSNLHCNVCAWYCWGHGRLHCLHRSAISPAVFVQCCAVLCCAVLCRDVLSCSHVMSVHSTQLLSLVWICLLAQTQPISCTICSCVLSLQL